MGFGAAIVSLAVAGLFAMQALAARTFESALYAHASEDQLALEEVESALLISHTALDAYLGMREASHRERHLRAVGKLESALAGLSRVVALDPTGQEDVARLMPELEKVRGEQDRVIELADAGLISEARALRARGEGTAAAGRAKDIIDQLETHAEIEVGTRRAAAERNATASKNIFLGAIGVLLVLVALAARLVRDEIRARERNEHERAEALEVQRRLMAVVSHDLRNPLTGILAAGWALSRAELPGDASQLARRIVTAGRRMERLIRDVLDWSRLHAGAGVPLTFCDADAWDVCRRIAEELSEQQGGRVELRHEGDTHAVFDPDRMEQVVGNLVMNALKYSPPDKRVQVRVAGEEAAVRIDVRDEGPGIPEGAREDLFEPFTTSRNGDSKDESRVGLGLFIVRTLTEAQGGRIAVESEPGRGTTFSVRIPRSVAAHVARGAERRT